MNKKDLFARALKHNAMHPVVYRLALGGITHAGAAARAQLLERRAAKLSRSLKIALPSFATLALGMVVFCSDISTPVAKLSYSDYVAPIVNGICAWLILCLVFGLMVMVSKLLCEEWFANPDERRFLTPVTGSPKEQDVSTLLATGGLTVSAWRDLAEIEHGELYEFDFEVMRSLYQIAQVEQREQRKVSEVGPAAVPPGVKAANIGAPEPAVALAA